MSWETVVGLEVHVQLSTRSKLFSGAGTAFGAPPNTQAGLYDLAMPGTLPMVNEAALRCAVKFGLAIGAEIDRRPAFDRKNYFYPDLPKGYQISQLDHPVVGRGSLAVVLEDGAEKVIGVTRAHLEEDAGKSVHDAFEGLSGIDLNRAGVPLLEIVSEPDMRGAAEAVAYLKKLHTIIRYLDISDAVMARGSMRCDANVSVRRLGETALGERTEIKNVNSFRFVEKAIEHEARRQRALLEDGGEVVRETLQYDAARNLTRPMRGKEAVSDYRYFPEPDLPPIVIDEAYIEAVRAELPELPDARRARFEREHGVGGYLAGVLTAERETADFYEALGGEIGDFPSAAKLVTTQLLGRLNEEGRSIADSPVTVAQMAEIVRLREAGRISGSAAAAMIRSAEDGIREGEDVAAHVERRGLELTADAGETERLVDAVVADSPDQVRQFREGREQVLGFLVGRAMRRSKGKADPSAVSRLLREKLEKGKG